MNFKQLLIEEEEINTFDKLLTAIENGRVPGVSPSSLEELEDYSLFNYQLRNIIREFKDFPSIYRNAAIKLATKHFIKDGNLISKPDPYLVYFNNRNKKEAKTIYKQLFTDFENGKIDPYDFEKKANELFKDKKVGKEDIDKLYEDNTYLVVIPKTYAASCKYGEGTKWCTTGSKSMFDRYNNRSPLIIIINKKTNKKYQLHEKTGSFMDETDIEPNNISDIIFGLPKEAFEAVSSKMNFVLWTKILKDLTIEKGNIEKIREAIKKGANIHTDDNKLLYNAVGCGDLDVLRLLVSKGARLKSEINDLFKMAVRENEIEIVKYLLDKGADLHTDRDFGFKVSKSFEYDKLYNLLTQYMKKEKK